MDYALQTVSEIPKPTPGASTRTRPRKYPFHDMEPGQMFFVPGAKPTTMMSLACATGKRLKVSFKTRRQWMVKAKSGWKQVAEGTPGAVFGVAVYRDL